MGEKREYKMSPIFYMGNKYKLLKQLEPLFPKGIKNFYDLFGGSGVVSINVNAENRYYNEINDNIYNLFKMFKDNTPEQLDKYFLSKIKEFGLEKGLGRPGFDSEEDYLRENNRRKEKYNNFRDWYNKSKHRDIRDLYLLSCYSINHLMRFNQNSEFNASFGATLHYQYKYIIDAYELVKGVKISCKDYKDVEIINDNTFIYFDPPYLNTTAVYNEKRAFGGWNIDNDYELFNYCEELNKQGIKWGLSNVFVNRDITNQHLIDWCEKNNWNVVHLNRNYNPFNRGNSNNDEVYICNYELN